MKISLDKILIIFFLLGIFFFSFNQVEMFPFMGEYVREFGALFFFLGFFVLILETLKTGKISLPFNSFLFQLILLFFIIIILCTVVNYESISNNYFKRTTGLSRFIRQLISLSIPIFILIPLFWKVLQNWTLEKAFYIIRKVFLVTLIFASFYSFFEVLYAYFHIHSVKPIIDFFDIFPFMQPTFFNSGRISSIAYEVPFFAIFLITISGWMFSYIITEKNIIKKITPTLLILLLTFFSGSRTGLIVIFFIFGLFVIYLFINKYYRKQIIFSVIFLSLSSLVVITTSERIKNSILTKVESLDFVGNLKNDISNQTRFGMQYASLQVFKENPVFGVGFGQQTFHSRHHYPKWATNNNPEYDLLFKNKKELSFPPGFNLYTRLLAETGLVGLISWLSIVFYSLYLTIKLIKLKSSIIIKTMLISIFISLVGLYINWLQLDTFRMYGVWLNLTLLMKISEYFKNKNNDIKSINNSALQ